MFSSSSFVSSVSDVPQNSRERASASVSPLIGMLAAIMPADCSLMISNVGVKYVFFILSVYVERLERGTPFELNAAKGVPYGVYFFILMPLTMYMPFGSP